MVEAPSVGLKVFFHVAVVYEVVIQVIEPLVKVLFLLAWLLLLFGGVGVGSLVLLFLVGLGLMAAVLLDRSQSVIVLQTGYHRFDKLVKSVLSVHLTWV